jgi:Fur family ferric uptake transcriptional regulator
MQKNKDYGDGLKHCGLKNTKHRSQILEILEQSSQPIAAKEVYLKMKEKEISVDLSTIYRALETLAKKNLATKLTISEDSRTLFEYNRMLHRHYLVCIGCKKILPINYCPLKRYEETLAKETNYTILRHRLNIYGYCPECKEKGLAG